MRMPRMRRPSPSLVVAVIALVVALGGTAIAQSLITGRDIRNGSITGKDIRNGTITGRKVKRDSLTGRQVRESSLGQVPSAANAQRLGGRDADQFEPAGRWALIQGTAAGATVLAQSGGFAVQRLATGTYNVDTGASASGRALTATINPIGGLGLVIAAPCGGSANNPGGVNCAGVNDTTHVLAQTFTQAGAAADRAFYLVVGG